MPLGHEEYEMLVKMTGFGSINWIPRSKAKEVFTEEFALREWAPVAGKDLPGLLFRVYSKWSEWEVLLRERKVHAQRARAIRAKSDPNLSDKARESLERAKQKYKDYRGGVRQSPSATASLNLGQAPPSSSS
jgi:hypothetical protein